MKKGAKFWERLPCYSSLESSLSQMFGSTPLRCCFTFLVLGHFWLVNWLKKQERSLESVCGVPFLADSQLSGRFAKSPKLWILSQNCCPIPTWTRASFNGCRKFLLWTSRWNLEDNVGLRVRESIDTNSCCIEALNEETGKFPINWTMKISINIL